MKTYSIQELAALAEVTVRTLHHYDTLGLLTPQRNHTNGYRQYNSDDLLKLQQIMFFRELDFPLPKIKAILEGQSFEMKNALIAHRRLIELKKTRMTSLLKTIDKTIKKITKEHPMTDDELYAGFSKEEQEAWNKEAEERWGDTDQYKQSVGKYDSLTDAEKKQLEKDGEQLMADIVANMPKGPESPEVQKLVEKHYNSLKFFYEPTLEMYRGLADMYVGYQGDVRFRAYFEKHHRNLPEFMRDAIYAYCAARSS